MTLGCNVYTGDLIREATSGGTDGANGGRGGASATRGGTSSGGTSTRSTPGGSSSTSTSQTESAGHSAVVGTWGGAAGTTPFGGAPNGGFGGGSAPPLGGNGGAIASGTGGSGNGGGITVTVGGTTSGGTTSGGTTARGGTTSGGTTSGGTTARGGTTSGGTTSGGTTARGGTTSGGTTSGGTTSGGAGGCGVAAGGSAACNSGDQLLVDDLEDGDQFIRSCNGRRGNWYVYRVPPNGSSTPAPGSPVVPEPNTDASTTGVNGKFAMHLNSDGTKAGDYGIGFSLNGSDTCKTTSDLSAYAGIRFMYRTDVLPANESPLRFQIPVALTSSIENGGTCPATMTCDNDHFSVELAASTTWKVVTVALDSAYSGSAALKLTRQASATAPMFDAKTVLTMQFNVHSTIDGAKFSLWVDNFVLLTSL